MAEILHTQYESMKLCIQEVNLWLPLPKILKMWLLSLVTIFSGLVQIFKPKIYFMFIMKSSQTFRKQCL